MAKGKKKKSGGKKRRSAAQKRATARLVAMNRKRFGGKKKRGKGGKKKSGYRAAKKATMGQILRMRKMVNRLMARGYTKQEAETRIRRLVGHASQRVGEAQVRHAEEAARQAAMANLWGNIGAAGRQAAMEQFFDKQAQQRARK